MSSALDKIRDSLEGKITLDLDDQIVRTSARDPLVAVDDLISALLLLHVLHHLGHVHVVHARLRLELGVVERDLLLDVVVVHRHLALVGLDDDLARELERGRDPHELVHLVPVRVQLGHKGVRLATAAGGLEGVLETSN